MMTFDHALQHFRVALAHHVERDPCMRIVSVDASLCDDGRDAMVYVGVPGDCTAAVLSYTLAHNERFDRAAIEAAFLAEAALVTGIAARRGPLTAGIPVALL